MGRSRRRARLAHGPRRTRLAGLRFEASSASPPGPLGRRVPTGLPSGGGGFHSTPKESAIMARSLVVRHDETPRTSLLFTSLLVLSCGLLAAGWWLGEDDLAPPASEIEAR